MIFPQELIIKMNDTAFKIWITLTKEINPTNTWDEKDFKDFLDKGNRSQTYDAAKRGFVEAVHVMYSEIAEATEEARKGTAPVYFETETGLVTMNDVGGEMNLKSGGEQLKPEGELIELADAVIRIMDYCGYKGWDLGRAILAKIDYNDSRAYRHGGKKF